jgi:hypothetical protein
MVQNKELEARKRPAKETSTTIAGFSPDFGGPCRAALINENCISCVFNTFSFLSASGMALNCKKLGA